MLFSNQPKNVNFFIFDAYYCCPICGMDFTHVFGEYSDKIHKSNYVTTSTPPPVCKHLLFLDSVEGTEYISHDFNFFLERCGFKADMIWGAEGMYPVKGTRSLIDIIIANSDKLEELSNMNIYYDSFGQDTIGEEVNFPEHSWTQFGIKNPLGE